jgi:probable HAF family extracellular repeat protein
MLTSKSSNASVVKLALLMMAATATVAAEPVSFTSFDIPGATNYFVAGINDEGLIAGSWFDAGGSEVGFIRSAAGGISTPIVDPNDGTGTTTLRAINDEGVVAGFYGANASTGFLLTEGKFQAVDFPGAESTVVRGVNNLGDVSGTYSIVDLNADEFGFIIPRRGPTISFKLPDPSASGIVVGGINDLRQLVGYYTDATSTLVGFLRQPSGQFVSVIFPGAIITQAYGINDCGIVVGVWGDGSTAHGFYGRPGNLHSFDLAGAADTFSQGINNEGRIVGRYATADGVPHAFVTARIAAASCL